jgi:putative redox protein
MTHDVKIDWQGKMAFKSEGPGGEIMMDASEAVGGEGKGVRPKGLMLSALAGCTAMDVASLFTKMRAEPEDFKILISAGLTEEHPKYYDKVKITYQFWGKDLKKDKLQKAVDMSLTKYCGVTEMFRRFAYIETAIEYFED